ncbi:hypothetical protein [Streptomyces sp. NPDC088270]|uniref:hypothetical protein n=1 Tax=Streptomyces sp. NPDC088270 TaxID=3160990 RepID=UPI0034369994
MIEHLAFEQLDAVDVSFDDARVPRQGEAGGGGIEVAADACGERVAAGRAVLSDGVEPVRQAFALVLCERGRESADMADEGIQFGVVGPDRTVLSWSCPVSARASQRYVGPPGDGPSEGGRVVTGFGEVRFRVRRPTCEAGRTVP